MSSETIQNKTEALTFQIDLPNEGGSVADFENSLNTFSEKLQAAIKTETDNEKRQQLLKLSRILDGAYKFLDATGTFSAESVTQLGEIKREYEAKLTELSASPRRGNELRKDSIEHLLNTDPDRIVDLLSWVKKKKNNRRLAAGYDEGSYAEIRKSLPELDQLDKTISNITRLINKIKKGEKVDESKRKILAQYEQLLTDYKKFYENTRERRTTTQDSKPAPAPPPADTGGGVLPDTPEAKAVREDSEAQFDTVRNRDGVVVTGSNNVFGAVVSGGNRDVKIEGVNVAHGGGSVVDRAATAPSGVKSGMPSTPGGDDPGEPAAPGAVDPAAPAAPDATDPAAPGVADPAEPVTPEAPTSAELLNELDAGERQVKELLDGLPTFSASVADQVNEAIGQKFAAWRSELSGDPTADIRTRVKEALETFKNLVANALRRHGEKMESAKSENKAVFEDPEFANLFGLDEVSFLTGKSIEGTDDEYKEAIRAFVESKRALVLAERVRLENIDEYKKNRQFLNDTVVSGRIWYTKSRKEARNKIERLDSNYYRAKVSYFQALQKARSLRKDKGLTNESRFNSDQAIMAARAFGVAGETGYRSETNRQTIEAVNKSAWTSDIDERGRLYDVRPRDPRSYRERELALEKEMLSMRKKNILQRMMGKAWKGYTSIPQGYRYAIGGAVAGVVGVATGGGLAQSVIRYVSGAAGGAVAGRMAGGAVRWVGNKFVRRAERTRDRTRGEVLAGFNAERFAELEKRLTKTERSVERREKGRDAASIAAAVGAGYLAGQEVGQAVEGAYLANQAAVDQLINDFGEYTRGVAGGEVPTDTVAPAAEATQTAGTTPVPEAAPVSEAGVVDLGPDGFTGDPNIYDPNFTDSINGAPETASETTGRLQRHEGSTGAIFERSTSPQYEAFTVERGFNFWNWLEGDIDGLHKPPAMAELDATGVLDTPSNPDYARSSTVEQALIDLVRDEINKHPDEYGFGDTAGDWQAGQQMTPEQIERIDDLIRDIATEKGWMEVETAAPVAAPEAASVAPAPEVPSEVTPNTPPAVAEVGTAVVPESNPAIDIHDVPEEAIDIHDVPPNQEAQPYVAEEGNGYEPAVEAAEASVREVPVDLTEFEPQVQKEILAEWQDRAVGLSEAEGQNLLNLIVERTRFVEGINQVYAWLRGFDFNKLGEAPLSDVWPTAAVDGNTLDARLTDAGVGNALPTIQLLDSLDTELVDAYRNSTSNPTLNGALEEMLKNNRLKIDVSGEQGDFITVLDRNKNVINRIYLV